MFNLAARLKNKISPAQKRLIIKLLRIPLIVVPHSQDLEILALKYLTDKWSHGYIPHYQQHFAALRHKRLNILEIGIGGHDNPQHGGASLRMWQEYFLHSMIYGIDIFDKSYHNDKRIKTFQGSQNDPDFLNQVAQQISRLDIIIDDGSHVSEHINTSFQVLFPYLTEGCIYVIEDLATSYWPQFGGRWNNFNDSKTSIGFLKCLVDSLNYEFIPNKELTYTDRNIWAIHFYRGIVFIIKGKNEPVLSKFVLDEKEKAKNYFLE